MTSTVQGQILPSTPQRILFIENSADNRILVEWLLEKEPFEIEVVENGKTGLEMFAKEPYRYGLVMMDIWMPVMDGVTIANKIRSLEKKNTLHPTPILLSTTNASAEEQKEAFEIGCDAYLTKPINKTTFIATIHKHLHVGL